MANAQTKTKAQPSRRVSISNTASNMLSSLHPTSKTKANAAFAAIKSDMADPTKVKKLAGFDDTYVARGHGIRVVFKKDGDKSVITSIAADR